MRCTLIVQPRAEADIAQGYWAYEAKLAGLGDQFLLTVDAAFERARRTPTLYSPVHRDVRRILVRRFPYAVFFVIRQANVHVLAVLPCATNPTKWKRLR